jgi:hypothetical protein
VRRQGLEPRTRGLRGRNPLSAGVHARQPVQVRATHGRWRTTLAEPVLQPELQPGPVDRLRPFAGGRVPGLAVGRSGDCRVCEGHDGGYHVTELARQAVLKLLLSPPCCPALLAAVAALKALTSPVAGPQPGAVDGRVAVPVACLAGVAARVDRPRLRRAHPGLPGPVPVRHPAGGRRSGCGPPPRRRSSCAGWAAIGANRPQITWDEAVLQDWSSRACADRRSF